MILSIVWRIYADSGGGGGGGVVLGGGGCYPPKPAASGKGEVDFN